MRQQGDSDDRIRYWDEYAVGYSSYQQGFMPGRIVDWMLETGYLRSEFSVLEVGCGPGTYSLELAPKVRILTCMDSSEKTTMVNVTSNTAVPMAMYLCADMDASLSALEYNPEVLRQHYIGKTHPPLHFHCELSEGYGGVSEFRNL